AQGVSAALARTGDYTQTLASRVAVAAAMHPKAFVSIHHNAEPDGPRPEGPGTETYYQTGKEVSAAQAAQSKRLAGLIYEEVVKALSAYQASWMADTDAGAKYRIGDSGNDYYGVLRISGTDGIVGSLAELAFLSNPSEEYLLKRDDVRRAEAAAVARAGPPAVSTRASRRSRGVGARRRENAEAAVGRSPSDAAVGLGPHG